MSWYGSHPIINKKESRESLPPAACKICVYFSRVFPGEKLICQRCGNMLISGPFGDIRWMNYRKKDE